MSPSEEEALPERPLSDLREVMFIERCFRGLQRKSREENDAWWLEIPQR
jgi:hypothetical protein